MIYTGEWGTLGHGTATGAVNWARTAIPARRSQTVELGGDRSGAETVSSFAGDGHPLRRSSAQD